MTEPEWQGVLSHCQCSSTCPETTQGRVSEPMPAKGKATSHWVLVAAILLQRVDSKQGEVWVCLGVVANVQVDHLLDYMILCASRLHN